MRTQWDHRYAMRTQRMKSSAIRELLKLTELPDIISFAGGLPAPDVSLPKKFWKPARGSCAASLTWRCSTARLRATCRYAK